MQRDPGPLFRWRGHDRPTAGIRASVLEPAVDDGVAEVLLYDPIDSWGGDWGVSAKEFVSGLSALGDDVTEIRLRINSPGGEVWEAVAMMNALRNHPARVVAVVDGLAASAASVLACAADETVMGRNTQLMIHDAWALCVGPAAVMRDTAERLDKLSDNLAQVYADKAGADVDDMRTAMLAETWYSPEEALAAGLVDSVEGVEPSDGEGADAARFDLSIFAYAGRLAAPAPKLPTGSRGLVSEQGPELACIPHKLPAAPAARAHTPTAPASGDTTQEGHAEMADITDEQLTTLRQTAGVADDADVDTALAAIAEALQEQADAPQNTPRPEGTILVDEAAFADLQAQAALGVKAHQAQMAAHRESVLDDAVRTGRISPAARDSWAALLVRDDTAEATLAGLPANTIPVVELGHVGQVDDPTATADDDVYASIYSKEA